MAESRTALTEASLDNESAEDLERRIEEKRRAISRNIAETRLTMSTEYEHAKEKVSDTMDWRLQLRRRPMAAAAGAFVIGFALGHAIAGSLRPRTDSDPDAIDFESGGARLAESRPKRHLIPKNISSHVEQAITGFADEVIDEIGRLGREIVLPGIMSALTGKLEKHGIHGSQTGEPFVGTSPAAGGEGGWRGRRL